jgi:hypothetical protein
VKHFTWKTNVTCCLKYFVGSVDLILSEYQTNGTTALVLRSSETGEPIAKVSVNIPDDLPAPGRIWVKGWSENEGMHDWLMSTGLATPTGRARSCGDAMAIEYELHGLPEGLRNDAQAAEAARHV